LQMARLVVSYVRNEVVNAIVISMHTAAVDNRQNLLPPCL